MYNTDYKKVSTEPTAQTRNERRLTSVAGFKLTLDCRVNLITGSKTEKLLVNDV